MSGFGSMLKDYLEFYKISQTDFASRLGITTKHMNNILNDKVNLSLELMISISLLTDIDVNLIFFVEKKKRIHDELYKKYKDDKGVENFLKKYYINELEKKGWITYKDSMSPTQKAIDLLEYLNISDFNNVDNYMNEKILYKKKDDSDMTKVYLWLRHCDTLIKNQNVSNYDAKNISLLLEELRIERTKEFNKDRLISIFNKYGIYLVIEDALPGTKIRGASQVKVTNPAIYITTYYKEKSSFYFTLYHEIGHIKTDFVKAKSKVIIDEVEDEQDKFALDSMISKKEYDELLKTDDVNNYCKNNNIPLTFFYSRLAYEGVINYKSKKYLDSKEPINL